MAHKHNLDINTLPNGSGDSHYSIIKKTVYYSVGISLIISVLKLFAWLCTNSASMQATFIDSLIDLVSAFLAMFAIYIAQKPADANHNFGHSKAEAVAALTQTMFIFASGLLLLVEVFEHAFNQEQVKDAQTGIWLILTSSLFLILLLFIQRNTIKKTNSLLIKSVAVHYKGDLLLNVGAMLVVWVSDYLDIHHIDVVFGCGVAIYVLYSGVIIFIDAIKDLMDKEISSQEQDLIKSTVSKMTDVISICKMQTRSAAHKKFVVLDIRVNKDISLLQATKISEKVTEKLQHKIQNSEVTVRPLPDE